MSMRTYLCAILLLLAVPMSGSAQQPGAWRITGSAGQTWFGPAAESDGTRFAPSSGFGLGLGISRTLSQWEMGLDLESRPSVLRASDTASVIQIASVSFGRSSAVLGAARVVGYVGRAAFIAGAGLRTDLWTLSEADNRLRLGGEMRVGLRLDAGPFRVENSVRAGMSASPLDAGDLPEGYRKRALRWISVGMAVSFGL